LIDYSIYSQLNITIYRHARARVCACTCTHTQLSVHIKHYWKTIWESCDIYLSLIPQNNSWTIIFMQFVARFKNVWRYISTPWYVIIKHRGVLTLPNVWLAHRRS